MAIGDLTPGRRVYVPAHKLEPGDYCFDREHQVWFCRPPVADDLLGNLIRHDVSECDDGSITVSPSIAVRCGEATWHGFLERGTWREV